MSQPPHRQLPLYQNNYHCRLLARELLMTQHSTHDTALPCRSLRLRCNLRRNSLGRRFIYHSRYPIHKRHPYQYNLIFLPSCSAARWPGGEGSSHGWHSSLVSLREVSTRIYRSLRKVACLPTCLLDFLRARGVCVCDLWSRRERAERLGDERKLWVGAARQGDRSWTS